MLNRLLIATAVFFGTVTAANAGDQITYKTHIRKIFRDHCGNCHNSSRQRAGLDLSSFGASMDGSSSGDIVVAGQPEESLLYLTMTHQEEPAMPPGKAPLKKALLEQVRVWIETGMPEKPGDQPVVPASVKMQNETSASTAKPAMDSLETNEPPTGVFAGANGSPVSTVAVSPDGRIAAVGSQLQVLLFDLADRKFVRALPFPEGEVAVVRFGSKGDVLLASGGTAAETGSVIGWNTNNWERSFVAGDEYDVPLGADIHPDGNLILFGGPERILKVADLQQRKILGVIEKHTDWVTAASFSPDGLLFATADRDGNVYAWESESRELLFSLRGHKDSVIAVTWDSSGDHCITASEDGTVRVWNLHSGQQTFQWEAHKGGVLAMVTTPSGDVITTGRDGMVKHWNGSGKVLRETTLDNMATAVSYGEGAVLLGDWQGQVMTWDLQSGEVSALQMPAESTSSEESFLLAEVSDLEPITELVEVSKPASSQAMPGAAAEAIVSVDGSLLERLDRIDAALIELQSEIEQSSDSTAGQVQRLAELLKRAERAASEISSPSVEVAESQVFLRAAIERLSSSVEGDRNRGTATVSSARAGDVYAARLQALLSELSKLSGEAASMLSDAEAKEKQAQELMQAAAKLKQQHRSIKDQLEAVNEKSKALRTKLKAETGEAVVTNAGGE